jgi:hypothetical protein
LPVLPIETVDECVVPEQAFRGFGVYELHGFY